MLNFPPDPSVSAVVEFTKTMYAQLHGQHFYPPKLFGTAPVPEGSKEWKEWDIGMKLVSDYG